MRLYAPSSLALSPVLLGATAVGLAATVDADEGPTLCPLRACTGGYCPGCGGARATLALLRGDLARSWHLHPWVPLLAAQAVLVTLVVGRLGQERVRPAIVPLLAANAIFGIGLWLARMATGAIPVPFG